MARAARIKFDAGGWYHLCAHVTGPEGEYLLQDPAIRQKFLSLIQWYVNCFMCKCSAVQVMGNHYHLVCHFDAPRRLSGDERMERALRFYPRSKAQIEGWPESKWQRFERRIFDVSEFMRNIQQAFATWYNRSYRRRGTFWAERFRSTLLGSPEAVLDCMLYVDLNAVRAGLVERPEDYPSGSAYLREIGADGWLVPLSEIFGENGRDLYVRYKEMLYHRGAVNTKEGQRAISAETVRRESARGFARRGVFRKRVGHFTDGLILGGALLIRERLATLRERGHYRRREEAIGLPVGDQYSLRKVRGVSLLI